MRKIIIASFAAVALFLVAAPVPAGEANTSVKPNPVRHGEALKMKAFDCVSGNDWDAVVEITIYELGGDGELGDIVYETEKDADDDGTTVKRKRIRKSNFPKGKYVVFIDCIHYFDEGGTGTWYSESHELRVKPALH